jgi:hypothetical protein
MIQATADQLATGQRLFEYASDPKGFITTCLDVKPEHYWDKMEAVANSVRDNQLTAVPACHSVSKTYGAGRIAVWFKTCFQPSTVITTAPSDNLVRNQLWKEIHAAYAGAKAPLGGKMTSLMWDCKPSDRILSSLSPDQRALWEKNFALGFSTSPDTATEYATKAHGWHNEWIFVLLDEAGDIQRPIWKTVIEGLMINKRCKILAIGNPTDPIGYFADVCKPGSGWNVINISVQDTPNFKTGQELIPNVAGRDYETRMRKTYGVNSNAYKIRVLGQFPSYREGTFYGIEIAKCRKEGRVGDYPHEEGLQVYSFSDLGDMYTAYLYAQFRQGRIRIIDCYWDNQGLGMPHHAKVIHSKPYDWLEHYTGRDIIESNAKSVQTGMMTKDIAAQLGINFIPVIPHSFEDGVQAVRSIWPLLEINKPLCKVFLQAVDGYRKKKNESISTDEQPSYHQTPIPNAWENHMMDALRHLAIAYRYMIGQGRSIARSPRTTTRQQDEKMCAYDVMGLR